MSTRWSRSGVAVLIAVLSSLAAAASTAAPDTTSGGNWIEAWYSPPFPPTAALAYGDVRIFARQTVRQVVRLEAGGDRLRVRLTNELGLSPVKIGSVHVALSSPNAVTEPETDHVLTFGGRQNVEIPVGQALVSDPVDMTVNNFAELGISIYYPERIAPSGHLSQVHLSATGDQGAEPVWRNSTTARAPALACGVEVQSSQPRRVVVAFGDSITEGAGATPGIHMDWPEQLALRLDPGGAGRGWVVINSGISGNRLLHEGAGPSALDRFDRDVLGITGVSAVILLEGINDIGWAFDAQGDTGPLTAADVIGGYKQIIARAHAHGLKIFGGTMPPYEGAGYYHPEGDAVRTAVNDWIRHGGAFDGVIDFDQAVRDPRHPSRYLGADQSGDSLHPNDAGYRAMTEAVDLRLLK
jgi:lysophospholipase L1-like esterase